LRENEWFCGRMGRIWEEDRFSPRRSANRGEGDLVDEVGGGRKEEDVPLQGGMNRFKMIGRFWGAENGNWGKGGPLQQSSILEWKR
jgi:hypothetical protein